MVYNPARMRNGKKRRPQTTTGGLTHKELVKRRRTNSVVAATKRENDVHGYRAQIFHCETFRQYYQCIYAKNNTGLGVSASGDKTLRVMQGTIFVTTGKVDKEDNVSDQNIEIHREGDFVNLPRGTVYSLATGSDIEVELLVTETNNYDETWKPLGDISVSETNPIFLTSSKKFIKNKTTEPRTDKSINASQKIAAAKRRHRTSRRTNSQADNANSSTVIGVNPRPPAPPTDD